MRFTSIAFVTVATLVSSVAAQNATCITGCFTQGASQTGCASLTDTTCVCYNDPLTAAVTACVTAACPDSLPALGQAQSVLCQGVSPPLVPHTNSGSVSVTQTELPTSVTANLPATGTTGNTPTTGTPGAPGTTKPTGTNTGTGTGGTPIPTGAASATQVPGTLVAALLAAVAGAMAL